jgi:hypothetical protein
LFCPGVQHAAVDSSPVVNITAVKLGTSLDLDYVIRNKSSHDVFVFSPFLRQPFQGKLDKTKATEIIWTTFPPGFKGNYFDQLDFVKIASGQSYTGHLTSVYAAQQMNNCTDAPTLVLKLAVSWAYDTEQAEKEWSKDKSESIRVVQKWQTVAFSEKYIVQRTGNADLKRCPAQEPVEIWR